MAGYDFYLDRCLLPIAPSSLQISIQNQNSTITLINEGQVNLLKAAGLTDIEFECIIPQVEYPFAVYPSGFCGAAYYLEYFEKLKTGQKPFQFIVTRMMPDGMPLFGTNIKVSMEDYRITEDAGDGFDLSVKIRLKQYKEYGTKSVSIKGAVTSTVGSSTATYTVNVVPTRSQESAPSTNTDRSYTVKTGDTLFGIAKGMYGDGSKHKSIYENNREVIKGGPCDLKAGQVLRLPAV